MRRESVPCSPRACANARVPPHAGDQGHQRFHHRDALDTLSLAASQIASIPSAIVEPACCVPSCAAPQRGAGVRIIAANIPMATARAASATPTAATLRGFVSGAG